MLTTFNFEDVKNLGISSFFLRKVKIPPKQTQRKISDVYRESNVSKGT